MMSSSQKLQLASKLNDAREYTELYLAQHPENSVIGFTALVNLLLSSTIAKTGQQLYCNPTGKPRQWELSGSPSISDRHPVELNNDRFLWILINMFADVDDGNKLKVSTSTYQYQLDKAGQEIVFRYEYRRVCPDHYPATHLHVYGSLEQTSALAVKDVLNNVHFPVARISIESVLRFLINEFKLNPNDELAWRPLLRQSEHPFKKIASAGRKDGSKPE